MNKKNIDEMDDIAAFHHAMRDVVPLKKNKSVITQKTVLNHRPRAKIIQKIEDDTVLTLFPAEYCSKMEPNSFLFSADPSLSNKVLRKFKRGQYNPEAALDLHGLSMHEAAAALDKFIQQTLKQHLRVLLVIHGKGKQAILKTQVNYWLKDHPCVLAFCSAKPKDGGLGAVYLLLKKSTSTGEQLEQE